MAGGYLLNTTVVLNLFQKLSTPALYFLNIQKFHNLKHNLQVIALGIPVLQITNTLSFYFP